MDPKKAVIAGSIGLVLIGLVVTVIVVYRQRALTEPSGTPSPINVAPVNSQTPPADTKSQPGSGTTSSATPVAPLDAPEGIGGVVHVAPDYTNAPDSDRDGLTNPEEVIYGTNPQNTDTDGDGLKDGDEIYVYGTNPLDPKSNATSGDGRYTPNKKQ